MKSVNVEKNRDGVALVTVLIIISLLTVLVMAYMSTSQIDHQSSTAYADTQRTKLVAQGAVAHAVEILRNNIPDPAGIDESVDPNHPNTTTASNWVINPGRLTVIDDQHKEETIDLHTGEVDISPNSTADPDVHSVDLNEPVPGKIDSSGRAIPAITYALHDDGTPNLNAPRPQMRVKWVNLLKDPSQPPSPDNPIIARHAFWIDDESGKINFNTAMGKPDPEDDPFFENQLKFKNMPPLFSGGEGSLVAVADEYFTSGPKKGEVKPKQPRKFGLGNSRSVNLDVLLDDPTLLDRDQLMAQTTLRGFSRYPEAVMDFINITDPTERSQWWYGNRYNLTSYSRSPEFNVFGLPRLMTTWVPLSLEGGPTYQSPFVYNDGSSSSSGQDERIEGILHLSGLLGTLTRNMGKARVGETTDGEDGPTITSRAVVTRYQLEMLRQYFNREFPGYPGTFVEKYGGSLVGGRECAQIALNIMAMSRYATAPISYDHDNKTGIGALQKDFPSKLGDHLASVLSFPNAEQGKIKVDGKDVLLAPERYYWWYEDGTGFLADPPDDLLNSPNLVTARPMLPIQPGPFITEVRIKLRPDLAYKKVLEGGKEVWKADPLKKTLKLQFQVEYYVPEMMGRIEVNHFPFKVDYITIAGGSSGTLLKLGADDKGRDWDDTFSNQATKLDEPHDPGETGLGALRVMRTQEIEPYAEGRKNQKNRQLATMGRLVRIKRRGKFRTVQRDHWVYLGENPEKLSQGFYNKGKATFPVDAGNLPKTFDFNDTPQIEIAFRGGMSTNTTLGQGRPNPEPYALQMIPLGVTGNDVLQSNVEVDMAAAGSSISWQIGDPRLSSQKAQWVPDPQEDLLAGTPGKLNENVFIAKEIKGTEPDDSSTEKSKFRSIQRGYENIGGANITRGDEMESTSRVASKGFWSFIHTGVQNGVPWRTLALNADAIGNVSGPPDWLLMDLMGTTQPIQHDQRKINATLPDEFSTISYMNSTTGAININTRTWPENDYFDAPERTKPLEAVFKHLRAPSDLEELLKDINSYQNSNIFRYVGDLALVDSYDGGLPTEWEKESLLRNMIGCLTTKSNTFGVWGVGQVVKKMRGNDKWGEFEDGDSVRGEKRFFAIVERYIWPGKDGVPGNAHVDANGELDSISVQNTEIPIDDETIKDRLFQLPGSPPFVKGGVGRLHIDTNGTYPKFDGPQKVEMNHFAAASLGKVVWNKTPLEDAYNPPQAVMKYRVVYFKYLDE